MFHLSDSSGHTELRTFGCGCQGMVHLHHSFLGTLTVGDSHVAVQLLEGDLPIGHTKAAGDWNRN